MLPDRHVAHRKYSGHAGLELVGAAPQGPLHGLQLLGSQIRTRLDEALLVERKAAAEPPIE
jgi:hypothetical protein